MTIGSFDSQSGDITKDILQFTYKAPLTPKTSKTYKIAIRDVEGIIHLNLVGQKTLADSILRNVPQLKRGHAQLLGKLKIDQSTLDQNTHKKLLDVILSDIGKTRNSDHTFITIEEKLRKSVNFVEPPLAGQQAESPIPPPSPHPPIPPVRNPLQSRVSSVPKPPPGPPPASAFRTPPPALQMNIAPPPLPPRNHVIRAQRHEEILGRPPPLPPKSQAQIEQCQVFSREVRRLAPHAFKLHFLDGRAYQMNAFNVDQLNGEKREKLMKLLKERLPYVEEFVFNKNTNLEELREVLKALDFDKDKVDAGHFDKAEFNLKNASTIPLVALAKSGTFFKSQDNRPSLPILPASLREKVETAKNKKFEAKRDNVELRQNTFLIETGKGAYTITTTYLPTHLTEAQLGALKKYIDHKLFDQVLNDSHKSVRLHKGLGLEEILSAIGVPLHREDAVINIQMTGMRNHVFAQLNKGLEGKPKMVVPTPKVHYCAVSDALQMAAELRQKRMSSLQ